MPKCCFAAVPERGLRGASQLADAIRITLGPRSKSVLIQKKWGTPQVCNDGVTVAKQMNLEDPEENLNVQMLRQAAERTGLLILRRALKAPAWIIDPSKVCGWPWKAPYPWPVRCC